MALEKISLLSVIPILPSFPALSHSHNCPASALGRVDLFRLLSIWPYSLVVGLLCLRDTPATWSI